MVSHAVWKTWPSGLSNDKNLGLWPRFLSTESLGPRFSHDMGEHDQILQQTMAAIARIPYVTSHSLQNGNCRNEHYISWYKCSLQVDTTIESDFVFLLCRKVAILVIWKANVNLSPRSSCNFGETRPCMREVISVSCQQVKPRTWFGCFQHGIHRVLPCTTRDLTVLLHNY